MTKTGVNNKLLKQKNRGLLLKLIATGNAVPALNWHRRQDLPR